MAEVRVNVDVRVDHPRHQRELLQVVGDRSGGRVVAARYARDARTLDDQCDVLLHATFAIEQARGPDDAMRAWADRTIGAAQRASASVTGRRARPGRRAAVNERMNVVRREGQS